MSSHNISNDKKDRDGSTQTSINVDENNYIKNNIITNLQQHQFKLKELRKEINSLEVDVTPKSTKNNINKNSTFNKKINQHNNINLVENCNDQYDNRANNSSSQQSDQVQQQSINGIHNSDTSTIPNLLPINSTVVNKSFQQAKINTTNKEKEDIENYPIGDNINTYNNNHCRIYYQNINGAKVNGDWNQWGEAYIS